MKKLKFIPIIAVSATLSFLSAQDVKAQDCSDYPYVAMETKFIPKGNGLFSLQVTQQQNVRADSTSQMERAMKIAELKGRQSISKFIKEQIEEKDSYDNESIDNAVENPDGVDWSIEEAGALLTSISSNSKNLARGVLPLGSCYQPGKFVRVTVGIKPETIAAAGNVDASSRNPYSGFSNKTNSSNTSNNSPEEESSSKVRRMQPFNTAPGYSGIDPDF